MQKTLIFSRILVALLLASNLLAAASFLLNPEAYAPAYELAGAEGAAAIRGVGLLFVMWNIPAMVALVHPLRFFVSLLEALGMQIVALVGETWIRTVLPAENVVLAGSIERFIWFDAAGLLLLAAAAWSVSRLRI